MQALSTAFASRPRHPHTVACLQSLALSVGQGRASLPASDVLAAALASGGHQASVLQLEQQVLVELNTEKNKTYEARISKIYPHFNETSQSYKVEARFLKEMPGLISGTQLQANIITKRKEKALLIPHVYVVNGNKVLIQKDKKIDSVTITTGIVSDDWIEVLSGLTVNDKIVKEKNAGTTGNTISVPGGK